MKARHLAIFEQPVSPLDAFIGEAKAYEEVTKAWVTIEPLQSSDTAETDQTTNLRRALAKLTWTPTTATIETKCRMRVEQQDGSSRTFGIDAIVNVNEANRELQMQVVERT